MKIEFLATFQGANVISLDDDMSAKLKFATDGSQLPQVIKLSILKGKCFRVTIEENGA